MSFARGKSLRRVFEELLVLIVGVLVALAVDRWVAGLDTRGLEHAYIARLIENVGADSIALEAQIATAARRAGWADDLFAAMDGDLPAEEGAGEFLRRLDRVPTWTPAQVTRDAWEDLVATGNVTVIRNPNLRQTISAYYNRAEREAELFADMDRQLAAIEMSTWPVLDPQRRLDFVEGRGEATLEEVRDALDRVRGDRVLHARLVQARIIHRVIDNTSRRSLAESSTMLTTLRHLQQ